MIFLIEYLNFTPHYNVFDLLSMVILTISLLHASHHRKNSEDVALLPAREASARYPQMVINFYEQKLTWHCSDEEQWLQRLIDSFALTWSLVYPPSNTPPPLPVDLKHLGVLSLAGMDSPAQWGPCASWRRLNLAFERSGLFVVKANP